MNVPGNNIFMALVQSFLDIVDYVLESLSDPWNVVLSYRLLL